MPLEITLAKKTTELVLLFYKNITKLIFLWLNMDQKNFKVLNVVTELKTSSMSIFQYYMSYLII